MFVLHASIWSLFIDMLPAQVYKPEVLLMISILKIKKHHNVALNINHSIFYFFFFQIERSTVLNESQHGTKNTIISEECHKCAIQNVFSDVFQGLYCMLTSEITFEATLLSSTMLSLLKQDKQFQYYDCRAWQLYPALLNLILAFTT